MNGFASDFKYVIPATLLLMFASCATPKPEMDEGSMNSPLTPGSDRHFSFTYSVQIFPSIDALNIFLPVAQSNAQQTILNMEVISDLDGEIRHESKYGNAFWYAALPDGLVDTLDITLVYDVLRPINSAAFRKKAESLPLSREEQRLFLAANAHVPVEGVLVDSIRSKLKPASPASLAKARAIYDYVVENMEYKKVGTGWGNGDTYWACSEQYGNCTDFHALFTSLARAEGIPSRFEIGFPIPLDKESGSIGGYHCWVYFYLPETGWFPIDASEARKDLSKLDLLFGTQPADRIQFSIGRDLELGEGHTSGPLNYFIYPNIEQNGSVYTGFTRSFTYKSS